VDGGGEDDGEAENATRSNERERRAERRTEEPEPGVEEVEVGESWSCTQALEEEADGDISM